MKRRILVFLCTIALVISVQGTASALVYFDFDNLDWLDGPQKIENYMEGIYGSDITVRHAIAENGLIPGPLYDYKGDKYLKNKPSLGTHWFEISFNEVPITAATFDWGVTADAFEAYADGVKIFDEGYHHWASGNTGLIPFSGPVTTLSFYDGFLGEIGIDDLGVDPVPEPATMLLLGTGLAGFAGLRRKFKN